MGSASRRRALADFLRSRRDRLTPAEVGLPAGPRRRAPGLRREELAQLAGVSVTWYTWLEQARDITVSRQVLASLARELRLSETERQHLFSLAEEPPPDREATSSPQALQGMVDALDPNPAYVLDAHWDFVAWNRAEAALIGDPALLPAGERNLLWLVFAVPRIRALLVDWPGQARNLLAQYRADVAHRAEDPRAAGLVRTLREASPEFGEWWAAHDVAPFAGNRRVFDHPRAGVLAFDYVKLSTMDESGRKLFTCLPADSGTAAKLASLTV
ncbi:helix-turn-helix transcriptional regulator [Amycolatopsis sp. FU40]|uniref:helix-turn-helix transcriptional regulator n=1 Tax=Amycolatopsis sp. FU40 TaxID=2914159 RepID=UPI001F3F7EF4|nr:helix-turn-helix transcriptional regulator [Amycolatopsis sp. FU40]UKD51804.1 helix-turn-helix transcriptional regulator [Amycolatopsis sp. FU40]